LLLALFRFAPAARDLPVKTRPYASSTLRTAPNDLINKLDAAK